MSGQGRKSVRLDWSLHLNTCGYSPLPQNIFPHFLKNMALLFYFKKVLFVTETNVESNWQPWERQCALTVPSRLTTVETWNGGASSCAPCPQGSWYWGQITSIIYGQRMSDVFSWSHWLCVFFGKNVREMMWLSQCVLSGSPWYLSLITPG